MASQNSDEAFARHLLHSRVVDAAQIQAATAEQIRMEKAGEKKALGDVMIGMGLITPVIREHVERLLSEGQHAGIQALGQFKLLKKLGEGGMGAVYLAEDTLVGRRVALKVLPKKHASDESFLTRFKREARATGKLNHENIVTAYTTGEELGFHYYVMEFCDGEPLDKRLKRDKVLPWNEAVAITIQVARGLQHAHDSQIIHRDIKPGNIFLTQSGTAKILDMGLSKNLGGTESSFRTETGAALGTPHYMSPEQARGDKNMDGRTDIYSLGATLYHLVTGTTPFHGSSPAVIMMKHLNELLPNPQDVREGIPDGVANIIRKMMAKDSNDRYRDCAALLRDLELVIAGNEPVFEGLDEFQSSVSKPLKALKNVGAARKGTGATARPVVQEPAQKKSVFGPALTGAIAAIVVIVAVIVSKHFSPQQKPNGPTVASKEVPAKVEPPKKDESAQTRPPAAPQASTDLLTEAIGKLKELNPEYDGKYTQAAEEGKVVELSIASENLQNIAPLKALSSLRKLEIEGVREAGGQWRRNNVFDLRPLEGMKLEVLSVAGSGVSKLDPLRRMPLRELNVSNTQVTDLTSLGGFSGMKKLICSGTPLEDLAPLEGATLESLNLRKTRVRDLARLKDMPLKELFLGETFVSDLTPLRGMALEKLDLYGTSAADLSPLTGMPLQELSLDVKSKEQAVVLKKIETLKTINTGPAEAVLGKFFSSETKVAVETLVREDFETLDLTRLPESIYAVQPGNQSRADMPGHGKVLKFQSTGANDSALVFRLDAAKVRGKEIRASVMAYCPDGYEPVAGQGWRTPRLVISTKAPQTPKRDLDAHLSTVDREWKTIAVTQKIADDAEWATVSLQLPLKAACFYDELKVEVMSPASLAPQAAVAKPTAPGMKPGYSTLAFEDFEQTDLKNLSPGWTNNAGKWMTVEPGKGLNGGKAVRLKRETGAPGFVTFSFKIDPEKVRGRDLRASVWAHCPEGYVPLDTGNAKPKLMIVIKVPEQTTNKVYEASLNSDERNWKELTLNKKVHENAESVTVALEMKFIVTEAFFDNLRIEIEDATPSAAPPPPAVAGPPEPDQNDTEVLVADDFDDVNLDALPKGWTIQNRPALAVVENPVLGKMLKIVNKDGRETASLDVGLDATKVRGRLMKATVMASLARGYTPIGGKPNAKPKFMLCVRDAEGKYEEMERLLEPTDRGWKVLTMTNLIPANAAEVWVSAKVPFLTAEVLFDALKVEVIPELTEAKNLLLDERFGAFNPEQVGAPWSIKNKELMSIVQIPGRGNVLRINNTTGKNQPQVSMLLKPELVSGKKVRVSVSVCCAEGFEAPNPDLPWKRPRLQFHYKDNDKYKERASVGEAHFKPPGKEWQRISLVRNIPQDAHDIYVGLCVAEVVANAYFDNLKVEIVPAEK